MDTMKGIRQHHAMASGGEMASGDFGCKALVSGKGPGMASEAMAKAGACPHSSRGAPPPVRHSRGKMLAQANANHGDHY